MSRTYARLSSLSFLALLTAAIALPACASDAADPAGNGAPALDSNGGGEEENVGEAASPLLTIPADACGTPHGTPGCNDAPVQACVCAQDAFCCNNQWDSICANEVTSLGCVPPATKITGSFACASPDSGVVQNLPLPHLSFHLQRDGAGDEIVKTDANGDFTHTLASPLSASLPHVKVYYDSDVGGAVTTRLQIMHEGHDTREEDIYPAGNRRSDGTLEFGTVVLSSVDCELWRLGVKVLLDYQAVKGASPPAGELRILRWAGVDVGVPYTTYDYINIQTDYLAEYFQRAGRQENLFHEFGHSIRHVLDGDRTHFDGDVVHYAYARSHDLDGITSVQFAFNEGWANYWSRARNSAHGSYCSGGSTLPSGKPCPAPGFRDWSESLIANRLLELASQVASISFPGDPAAVAARKADAKMVDVLASHPGSIHSLREFEEALAGAVPGVSIGPAPASCPPGYTDDGLTCRKDAVVIGKPSYGRGVGLVPSSCNPGEEKSGALCYPACAPGYYGVGPVCWQACPAGYSDDGLTCRRDAVIFGSDNSNCPWYDVCGLTFAQGCSVCPPGYNNDGCTCRIDAHIFGKSSYGRGVGHAPGVCSPGMEYDAGLCYWPCGGGFDGVGPVCWGECPAGFDDHGATCYQGAHIITKY